MGEMDLERNKRPIWPWIIGLLVFLLLTWIVVEVTRRDRPDAVIPSVETNTVAPERMGTTNTIATRGGLPLRVEEFVQACQTAAPAGAETAESEAAGAEGAGSGNASSTDCFELLASAISAIAARRPGAPHIKEQIQKVGEQVKRLRRSDPGSLDHADATRRAAQASTEALATLQQAFAGANQRARASVENVRQAALQIDATEESLDQGEALRSFFREAGNALQDMASDSGPNND